MDFFSRFELTFHHRGILLDIFQSPKFKAIINVASGCCISCRIVRKSFNGRQSFFFVVIAFVDAQLLQLIVFYSIHFRCVWFICRRVVATQIEMVLLNVQHIEMGIKLAHTKKNNEWIKLIWQIMQNKIKLTLSWRLCECV